MNPTSKNPAADPESTHFLKLLAEQEKVRDAKLAGIKTVLVVLSSRGMVFDRESLRQKVLLTYPDATVFFKNTMGLDMGAKCPSTVDLLLDLTGPGQKQGWFYARKLRGIARVAIGRNAGIFRARIYDRIFDEKRANLGLTVLPLDILDRERFVQKQVLALAGVVLSQYGDTPRDKSYEIASTLPPMAKH